MSTYRPKDSKRQQERSRELRAKEEIVVEAALAWEDAWRRILLERHNLLEDLANAVADLRAFKERAGRKKASAA